MGLDIYVHSLVYIADQLGMTKSPVRSTLRIWQATSWARSY